MLIENKLIAKNFSDKNHGSVLGGSPRVQPPLDRPPANSNPSITNVCNKVVNGFETAHNASYVNLPCHFLSPKNRSVTTIVDILRLVETVKPQNCYNYRMQLSMTIKQLIDASGLTQSEIARRLEVNESAVRGWVKTGSIKNIHLAKLAELCGYIANIVLKDGEQFVSFISKESNFVPVNLTKSIADLAYIIEGLDDRQKNFITNTTFAIRKVDPQMLVGLETMILSLAGETFPSKVAAK